MDVLTKGKDFSEIDYDYTTNLSKVYESTVSN